MQTEWKYIVIRGTLRPGQAGHCYVPVQVPTYRDHPILFPRTLTHAEMYESVRWQEAIRELDDVHVIAAGFCYPDMEKQKWECFGDSQSLKDSGEKLYKSRGHLDAVLMEDLWKNSGCVEKTN